MTDSYVPTLNANGSIQNVATQQSERGGKTIETQEFTMAGVSTETKQDALITAIGTLQSTVESLTTAVGLLAKLTDTQPVSALSEKVESAAFSTGNKGIALFGVRTSGGGDYFSTAVGDFTHLAVDGGGRIYIAPGEVIPVQFAAESSGLPVKAVDDGDGGSMFISKNTIDSVGTPADDRSIATDTTAASLIALTKQNNYLLQQLIDALTP